VINSPINCFASSSFFFSKTIDTNFTFLFVSNSHVQIPLTRGKGSLGFQRCPRQRALRRRNGELHTAGRLQCQRDPHFPSGVVQEGQETQRSQRPQTRPRIFRLLHSRCSSSNHQGESGHQIHRRWCHHGRKVEGSLHRREGEVRGNGATGQKTIQRRDGSLHKKQTSQYRGRKSEIPAGCGVPSLRSVTSSTSSSLCGATSRGTRPSSVCGTFALLPRALCRPKCGASA